MPSGPWPARPARQRRKSAAQARSRSYRHANDSQQRAEPEGSKTGPRFRGKTHIVNLLESGAGGPPSRMKSQRAWAAHALPRTLQVGDSTRLHARAGCCARRFHASGAYRLSMGGISQLNRTTLVKILDIRRRGPASCLSELVADVRLGGAAVAQVVVGAAPGRLPGDLRRPALAKLARSAAIASMRPWRIPPSPDQPETSWPKKTEGISVDALHHVWVESPARRR